MRTSPIVTFQHFAVDLAIASGRILKHDFQKYIARHPHIIKKERRGTVTKTDKDVHRFAVARIQTYFPEHNIVSEEGEPIDNHSEYTWVIDPLDGTLNYSIANPFFSTSVTLMKNNIPIVAVIYAPMLDELFVAHAEGKTRLNKRVVHVSHEQDLARSVLSFSYFCRDNQLRQRALALWALLEDKSCAMRHLGCVSLELAYIAAGRMEAQILMPPLKIWDVMGGALLVTCAGGKITDFSGKPWNGNTNTEFVASNGVLQPQLLKLIKKINY